MLVRLPIGRSLFLLAAFLFALLALLPLRLAIDWLGFERSALSARAATGSVWVGALQEARVGPVALGDVEARLNLLPLFLGRARLSLIGTQASGVEGAIAVSRHSLGFEDFTGRLRIGAVASRLPLSSLALDDVSAGFESGQCVRAEGRVSVSAAAELAAAGELTGAARCDGDALLFPLASRSGGERLDIRLFGDGRYRLDLLVRPADEGVRSQLIGAGFRPAGAALGLRVDGAF